MLYIVRPKPGNVVPIFILNDNGEFIYECTARLLEKLDSIRYLEPIPIIDLSPDMSVNVLREKWSVEIISNSPFDHGRKLRRFVNAYHSTGVVKTKECEEQDVDTLLNDDNLLI